MARPSLSFAEAQRKLTETFPDRGLELITYNGAREPCILRCPIHGEVEVSTFGNALRSVLGCPSCGKVKAGLVGQENMRKYNDTIQQLRSLPPTLSDAEFRKKVLELLNN